MSFLIVFFLNTRIYRNNWTARSYVICNHPKLSYWHLRIYHTNVYHSVCSFTSLMLVWLKLFKLAMFSYTCSIFHLFRRQILFYVKTFCLSYIFFLRVSLWLCLWNSSFWILFSNVYFTFHKLLDFNVAFDRWIKLYVRYLSLYFLHWKKP